MVHRENDIVFFEKIKNLFKKSVQVKKNQLGIYHYVLVFDSVNTNLHEINCDVFLKVKAIEIFDEVVEIEVKEVNIAGFSNDDINHIINCSLPRYVNPKLIKWQIND